jgi:DUF2971 family protein
MPKSRKHLERRRHSKSKPKHPSSGIAKFFEQTVLTAGRASPHRVLYHYTTRAGAIGIVGSQKFWSTAHDCTNDEAELISANSIVTAVAEACRPNARGASRTVLDVFLANYPASMLVEVGIVYLACFSTERDDPNQWREYGDKFCGVCLGVRILEEPGPKLTDRVSVMLEVDYSETSLRKWLKTSFDNICAALARAQDTRHNHEEGLSALYRIAAYASIKAKQDKWKNEREVRLATLAPSESRIVPSERISAAGKVIRYLPVAVRAGDKLIALDEIIIGSNQDTDRAQQEFETLLATKGYTPGTVEYPRITVSGSSPPQRS